MSGRPRVSVEYCSPRAGLPPPLRLFAFPVISAWAARGERRLQAQGAPPYGCRGPGGQFTWVSSPPSPYGGVPGFTQTAHIHPWLASPHTPKSDTSTRIPGEKLSRSVCALVGWVIASIKRLARDRMAIDALLSTAATSYCSRTALKGMSPLKCIMLYCVVLCRAFEVHV